MFDFASVVLSVRDLFVDVFDFLLKNALFIKEIVDGVVEYSVAVRNEIGAFEGEILDEIDSRRRRSRLESAQDVRRIEAHFKV